MTNSTPPAASQPNPHPRTTQPHPTSPAESPLDHALAAFNSHPLPKPKVNDGCTSFAKRWADVAPRSYRPSFGYLGEANPDLYGNPVAVESLGFVGAPLPWDVQGGGREVQMPEIREGGGSEDIQATGGKAKAKAATGTNAKSRARPKNVKGKPTAAQATKKTPTSVVPKPPVQTSIGGRQTRSMTKAKAPGANAGLSISTGPKKDASKVDVLDVRPAKRARVSVPQDAVAREAPKSESEEQEEANMEKLVIRLPPLAIVRVRSSDNVVDENETKAAVGTLPRRT